MEQTLMSRIKIKEPKLSNPRKSIDKYILKCIPNDDDLIGLEIGSLVNICCGEERFWCEIIDINKTDYTLTGMVDNELELTKIHELSYRDLVKIKRENVYEILKGE